MIAEWAIVFGGDLMLRNPDNLNIRIYAANEERTWTFECNYVNQNGTPGGIYYRGLVEAMLGRKLRKRERVSIDRLHWILDDRRVTFDVIDYPHRPDIEPRVTNIQPQEHRPA